MSARIPPGFFETVTHFTVPGQSGEVEVTHGWDGGDPLDVGWRNDFETAFLVPLVEQCSSSISATSVDFVIGQDGDIDVVITDGVLETGSGASDMVPCNTAWLISRGTAGGGRRGKGRFYMPGVTEASVLNDGTYGGTVQDAWASNLLAFVTDTAALDPTVTPVLFHQSAPFDPTPITAFVLKNLISEQRRRLRG